MYLLSTTPGRRASEVLSFHFIFSDFLQLAMTAYKSWCSKATSVTLGESCCMLVFYNLELSNPL